ncbi:thialysine N-epsilon-acetyltransferase-like [Neocloeon triangulifer]|uniref:thialysine N-epsilon-acetyltransferase-like n=1 Tax=Neocloeon triangulifer TaxID=2078957 RepID=UPI00286EE156|nr:thialysine N-epsilon-acetyltransferase-like [Neocloeon triangulifer]
MSSVPLIRTARKEDCKEIQRLIQELATYEKFPHAPKLKVEDLERDGFESSPPKFKCFVAENPDNEEELCGYAMYYPTYSAWDGKAIRLEDLFVAPEGRGTGLGKRLFSLVAKEALEGNYCRVEFTALGWNQAAGFYTHLGAENTTSSEDRNVWRLYRSGMEKLLENSNLN